MGKTKKFASISRRLILYIVLCSSLITLILSGCQLDHEYQADITALDRVYERIAKVHLQTISATLWSTETTRMKAVSEGLSNYTGVTHVAVLEVDEVLVSVGTYSETDTISRSFPLKYKHRGEELEIGRLRVTIDLGAIYRRLLERAMVILAGNAIKTALVVVFMLLVFHAIVTRHFRTISGYIGDIKLGESIEPLKLLRKKSAVTPSTSLI